LIEVRAMKVDSTLIAS